MDAVFEAAGKKNSAFVEKYFEDHKETDWISIAKRTGHVVNHGTMMNEPAQQEIDLLAQKLNMPIFTYSRPKVVEEKEIKEKTRFPLNPGEG